MGKNVIFTLTFIAFYIIWRKLAPIPPPHKKREKNLGFSQIPPPPPPILISEYAPGQNLTLRKQRDTRTCFLDQMVAYLELRTNEILNEEIGNMMAEIFFSLRKAEVAT